MGHTEAEEDTHAHQGGLMLAVRVTPGTEAAIMESLRAAGVENIERTQGEWRNGHWVDFDPTRPPEKIGG